MYFHYHVVAHAKENHVDFNHDTNPVNDSLHSTETLGGGASKETNSYQRNLSLHILPNPHKNNEHTAGKN